MSQVEEMQDEIAQLKRETQDRIAQLEEETSALKLKGKAQAVRQRFVLGLAIVGVGLAFMTHKGYTQTTESGVFICRQIKIIDADRKVRMTLGTTVDNEGVIEVYNGQNRRIAQISATVKTGAGAISVYDEEGRKMVGLSSAEGKGGIWTQK